MAELLAVGFDNTYTSFLAGATLARLQVELSFNGHDIAVLSRNVSGEITIREAIDLETRDTLHESFWKTMAGLLFPRVTAISDSEKAVLSAIGIDDNFITALHKTIGLGTTGLLALVSKTTRDPIIGVLRGFGAQITKCHLIGDNREQWLKQLSNGRAMGNDHTTGT